VPEPLALPRTFHVDSREDHGELRLLKFDAVVFVGAVAPISRSEPVLIVS